jgi:hypothetical protein
MDMNAGGDVTAALNISYCYGAKGWSSHLFFAHRLIARTAVFLRNIFRGLEDEVLKLHVLFVDTA